MPLERAEFFTSSPTALDSSTVQAANNDATSGYARRRLNCSWMVRFLSPPEDAALLVLSFRSSRAREETEEEEESAGAVVAAAEGFCCGSSGSGSEAGSATSCKEDASEGADDVASMILSRSVATWTNGGRALALAVCALAQQDLDQARHAECLVSLPGRRPLRLGALRTLSTLGALMDPELKRRVERLVTVVDAA